MTTGYRSARVVALGLALSLCASCIALPTFPDPRTLSPPAPRTPPRFNDNAESEPVTLVEDTRALIAKLARRDRMELPQQVHTRRLSWSQAHTVVAAPLVMAETDTSLQFATGSSTITLVHHHRPIYPYPFDLRFTETIAPDLTGSIAGADTFGGPTKARPLSTTRAVARAKWLVFSHPARVASVLMDLPVDTTSVRLGSVDGKPAVRVVGAWNGAPIGLVLSFPDGRPLFAFAIEDDAIRGDVVVTTMWTGLARLIADEITVFVDDRLVEVSTTTPIDHKSDSLPGSTTADLARAADGTAVSRGVARARFYTDWIAYGFPHDDDEEPPVVLKEIAPGVLTTTGTFHNALLVELDPSRWLLVEAPFSPEHVDAIFAALRARDPSAQVTGVVSTHWHEDHAGGLRAAFADDLPVWLPRTAAAPARRIARAKKTVVPDRLSARTAVEPVLHVVDRETTIPGSARSVVLFPVANAHVDGMLVVYLPAERILYNADLMNPGLMPMSGLEGLVFRTVAAQATPYTLLKGGTYAQALVDLVDRRGFVVDQVVGGHGSDVVDFDDVRTLASYGDATEYGKLKQ